MASANSPVFPIQSLVLMSLILFTFSLGFNVLVKWKNEKRLWPVSLDVAFGVAVTVAVPTMFFLNFEVPFWKAALVYALAFASSGPVMIVGNVHRDVKDNHKARKLGNTARKVRDHVCMDLNKMADEIVNEGVAVEKVVHRLHQASGSLRSLE